MKLPRIKEFCCPVCGGEDPAQIIRDGATRIVVGV